MKGPPQSLEAEVAVLGACFHGESILARALGRLSPGVFFDYRNALVFEAMKGMAEAGVPLDLVSLSEAMNQAGTLVKAGGNSYLAHLYSAEPTPAHLNHHCDIVEDRAIARALAETGREMVQRAGSGDTATEILTWVGGTLDSMTKKQNKGDTMNCHDLINHSLRLMDKRAESDGPPGIETGFVDLDRVLLGLRSGELTVLAARPSMGKSALALNIALNAAKAGQPALFITLEMSMEQIMDRVMAITSGISLTRIMSGLLNDKEHEKVTSKLMRISDYPLFLADMAGPTIEEIKAVILKLHHQKGLGLVVLDYMQLIRGTGRSREEEVSGISRAIKGLAKKINAPVLALSQLNRAVESREKKRPRLSDLRESGSIEQDADVVMFIYRGAVYNDVDQKLGKNTTEIIIAKNRQGGTDTVKLFFVPHLTQFRSIAWGDRVAA